MPRPAKKAEDKAKVPIPATTMVIPPVIAGIPPPVNPGNGPRIVEAESFMRVRDAVSSFIFSLQLCISACPLLPLSCLARVGLAQHLRLCM